MKAVFSLLIFIASNSALAAPPLAIDFSDGQPTDYFTESTAGRVSRAMVDGVPVLQAADATVHLQDVPVVPSSKYSLRLRASFGGEVESIEENPRFDLFHRMGQTSNGVRLVFSDLRLEPIVDDSTLNINPGI